ncbi:MAG: protein-L-isoaspartate O-methyltransferase [Pacificimonas sp.]
MTSPKAGKSKILSQPDFARLRSAMVDSQLRPNSVTQPAVVDAFLTVPREDYVPAAKATFAYHDEDIEVAPGRFLLEPLTTGRLIAESNVRAGERVLVVGGVTGYSAALLAHMGAHVTMVEEDGLAAEAAARLSGTAGVDVVTGDLSSGHADAAPYDLVIVEGTVPGVPDKLIAQVKDDGRIAAIVMHEGSPRAGIGRVHGGHVGWSFYTEAYVPVLPGFAQKREFVF